MREMLVFVVCVLWAGAASGQIMRSGDGRERWVSESEVQHWIEEIVQEIAEEGNDAVAQQVLEHYAGLAVNPLEINGANREDLEKLGILTEFQIASLLEYLKNSGYIFSTVELQLVNGFNERTVSLLKPFISFHESGSRGGGNSSTLLFKWWWREGESDFVGPPYYTQLRYNMEFGERLKMGFIIEKDPGEEIIGPSKIPFGDFNSMHLAVGEVKLGRNFSLVEGVLGDYKIKFGQGLTVWNGFNLSGTSTVQGMYKGGGKILSSTSADENNYFRGAAGRFRRKVWGVGELESTFFISMKRVDARLDGDKYTSLPTDGLHNTKSSLECRKSLRELVYGANLQLTRNRWRIGLNWVGYGYDKHNGRGVREYNKYQMYDGIYGNVSADFYTVFGKSRVFGEVAADYGGTLAFLAGFLTRLGEWDAGVILRSYPRGYIAPYANAYSTISSCSNQNGVALVLQRGYNSGLKLSMGGDFSHYPWERFNIGEESGAVKLWGKVESLSERVNWNLKMYGSYATYQSVGKVGLRGVYGIGLLEWLGVKIRGESVCVSFRDMGIAVGMDVDINSPNDILRLQMRGVYHNCKEWNSRLYMYEADLPLSYTSRLLYGEGFKWFAMLSTKIRGRSSLYIKCDGEPKVKIGLKMRFF